MAPRRSSPSTAVLAGAVLLIGLIGGLIWVLQGDATESPGPEPTNVDPVAVVGDPELPTPAGSASDKQPEALETSGLLPDSLAGDTEAELSTLLAVGQVLDANGQPLHDIEVNLYDSLGDYTDSVSTDESGAFALHSPDALVGGWALATEPDVFSDQDDPNSIAPAVHVVDERWVPGDPPVQVDLVLYRAPRLIGRVLDARTGKGIDFADVELVSTLPSFIADYQDTFTEEDGSFALSIVDMPYTNLVLRATDDDDQVAMIGPFDMQPGEERYIELRVSAGYDIHGVVRTLSGTPVNGADVMLLPLHPDLEFTDDWDVTLEDGEFTFRDINLGADQVLIYAQADDYGPVIVRPIEPRAPVDILLGGLVAVEGKVLSASSGEPIDGADLTFTLRGPSGLVDDYEDYCFTEIDGSFEVLLEMVPVEATELLVEAEDHVTKSFNLADLAPVNNGWERYEIEVRLEPLP
ncbi:MAG: hypothetical protein DHS20C15_09060 [Planctomycetota bacterium]|nr:MAG: hypothetical protein DHS20C15_09060 [Planctomycetota bacterium]